MLNEDFCFGVVVKDSVVVLIDRQHVMSLLAQSVRGVEHTGTYPQYRVEHSDLRHARDTTHDPWRSSIRRASGGSASGDPEDLVLPTTAPVATCATLSLMSESVSVRELRNTVSQVLRRVEGGERVTVTVDRRPVAELVPLRRRRTVSIEEARGVVSRHAADRRLLGELSDLLRDTTDDA